ncbi:308L [Invertebrate iridescent virus Kaz2018]|uniref:Uncharacterized protein 308L n=1 Tax=Invertebrate iridescent virus 6 TaxID=176652 RepID=308L_IIV6|nr:308L [Invertebrate iridescent virus 6]Q91FL6.1 RecName: Full=Uncharacterized protein 308L; Flags: Precursor [Invertebrate iridescent virus 6]AAK82169.1 308L [Invertebrate iridescent virus 6]QNH08718.1 308L [Invertebrate iridescent virus Kaz2018]
MLHLIKMVSKIVLLITLVFIVSAVTGSDTWVGECDYACENGKNAIDACCSQKGYAPRGYCPNGMHARCQYSVI